MSDNGDVGFDEATLKSMCRDLSLSRMKTHSCIDDIKVEETEDFGKKDETGQWLSLIFVSSHAVKLNFKCKLRGTNFVNFPDHPNKHKL